jgi:cytochrome P450
MAVQTDDLNAGDVPEVPDVPLRTEGHRLSPRLPVDEITSRSGLLQFRFPNGVTGYVTTTAEDFRNILTDPRFHAKRFLGEPQPGLVSIEVPDMPGFIPSMNGPDHLRTRRRAAADFSVKRVQELRPRMEAIVDRHLEAVVRHGPPVDLYEHYTLPIPSEVIAMLLGVPTSHTPEFQAAARLTIGGHPAALDDPQAPARAVAELHRIIGEVIELKRRDPADDLVSRLALSQDPPLSDVEIEGLCTNLLIAGHESTSTTSAIAILALLEDPSQLAAFRSDPDRLPQAIDELIRFVFLVTDSGAGIPRLATEDVDYKGQLIRKGDWVMPTMATANVDPTVCPYAATELDLSRDSQHLTFGFGPHTCLGQHLARAEMQLILWRLFERLPALRLEVSADEMPWYDKGYGYRMSELMVSW